MGLRGNIDLGIFVDGIEHIVDVLGHGEIDFGGGAASIGDSYGPGIESRTTIQQIERRSALDIVAEAEGHRASSQGLGVRFDSGREQLVLLGGLNGREAIGSFGGTAGNGGRDTRVAAGNRAVFEDLGFGQVVGHVLNGEEQRSQFGDGILFFLEFYRAFLEIVAWSRLQLHELIDKLAVVDSGGESNCGLYTHGSSACSRAVGPGGEPCTVNG